jgi:hypothetical protein
MRSWNLLVFSIVSLILAPWPTPAAETEPPAAKEKAPENKHPSITELHRERAAAYAAEDYRRALEVCRTMVELAPNGHAGHYNLACAQARLGRADEALASLAKAVSLGFAAAEHMNADGDLATLRADPRFDDLVKTAAANQFKAEARFYDKGAEIEGVKTVEGQPEGGLRWRLRISPEATAEKPYREAGMPLVVHYVKGGKHAWLLGKHQLAALLAWLDEVIGGGLPQLKGRRKPASSSPGIRQKSEPLARLDREPRLLELAFGA